MNYFLDRLLTYTITVIMTVASMYGAIVLGDAGQHAFALICLAIGGFLSAVLAQCINEDVNGN